MARAKSNARHMRQRMTWQQRYTLRVEADRLLDQHDDLRIEVRTRLRAI